MTRLEDVAHIVDRWQPDGIAIARITLSTVPERLHREADALVAGGHIEAGQQMRAVAERLRAVARRLAAEPSAAQRETVEEFWRGRIAAVLSALRA